MNYVYDTNIFIYFLDDSPDVKEYFKERFFSSNKTFTSRITRIELLSYPNLTEKDEVIINDLFKVIELVPLSEELEELAIAFRKRHRLKIPDAVIAATAFQHSATLVTNNIKDFKNIPEIKIVIPKRKK